MKLKGLSDASIRKIAKKTAQESWEEVRKRAQDILKWAEEGNVDALDMWILDETATPELVGAANCVIDYIDNDGPCTKNQMWLVNSVWESATE